MNHQAKLSEVLHRTARALLDMAHELTAIEEECVGDVGFLERSEREIVDRITVYWDGTTLGPMFEIGELAIDLATPEGKWELLVIALLRAARVKEETVAETFHALKTQGLLSIDCLAVRVEGDDDVRSRVLDVFHRSYKALGRKEAKVEALFFNASLLVDRWDGDLNNLYEAADDDQALIAMLQEFRQIRRVALWIGRTLRVHGVWPDVGVEASRYVDRFVRLPIERLGLTTDPHESQGFPQIAEETAEVVASLFGGDVVPLYLHGYTLCAQNEPRVCLLECPVAAWCRYPQQGETGV